MTNPIEYLGDQYGSYRVAVPGGWIYAIQPGMTSALTLRVDDPSSGFDPPLAVKKSDEILADVMAILEHELGLWNKKLWSERNADEPNQYRRGGKAAIVFVIHRMRERFGLPNVTPGATIPPCQKHSQGS